MLDTGRTVVVVLEDRHPALFDGFYHIEGGLVVFQLIQLRLSTDMVNGFVQQVAGGRLQLPHRPVIAARIIPGGELPRGVRFVAVDELLALEHAVNRPGQGGVPLRRAGFLVRLGDDGLPFLQDVFKGFVRHFVPFDDGSLVGRHYVPIRRSHLFQ